MTQSKSLKTLLKASKAASNNKLIESVSLCKKAISQSATNTHAYKLLATNLIKLERFVEVGVTLKKVIKLVDEEESYPLIHLLGTNYISLGNYHNALDVLEDLFNKTGNSNILLDIGLAHFNSGATENARAVYLKLIELEPDNHDAKRNLFPILLRLKEYQAAWVCFHSRLELPEVKDKIHWFAPQWSGEPLVGKNVLIFPEQGIGDNLEYTACFAEAIADAKKTYIICDKRLKGLYQSNFPSAQIISNEEVNRDQAINAELDLQILAGSLTYLYRPSEESFGKQQNLITSTELFEAINQRLSKNKLRVGISWFHGRVNDNNAFSMYLEELLPLLKIGGIEWVNLQFGDWQKEVKQMQNKHGIAITHLEDCSAAGDFERYGALIKNCDLVISPSNAALMLATRLGVTSWMFLPNPHASIENVAYHDGRKENGARHFYNPQGKEWSGVVQLFCDEIKLFDVN